MRHLISKRNHGEGAGRSVRPWSFVESPRTPEHVRSYSTPSTGGSDGSISSSPRGEELLGLIEDAAAEADAALIRASASQEALGVDIALLAKDLKEVREP